MIYRLLISAAMLVGAFVVAAPADACGIPKPNNPHCPPPDVCVCPVIAPTAAPTAAPTPVPPVPAQFSVTPLPVATPIVGVPVPAPAATGSGPINSPRLSEYCHYEPSTAQWEIRLSSDADGMVRKGGENPIAPHVCDQHQPLHPPFVESAPESVPDAPQPLPEIVELPPAVVELPMADEPVVTPVEPAEAPITVDEVTVTVPESVPVCVPVQIPTDEPCSP